MNINTKKTGITLIEMTVVTAAVVLLAAFALPAARQLFSSMTTESSARAMIGAALSSARAIAIKEHRYAGLRFQKAGSLDDPLNAPQYVIFIEHRPKGEIGYANGFRAVEGLEPIKLPEGVGVMEIVSGDGQIDDDEKLITSTTFSIVFSPSGKLITHEVRVRNRDGKKDGTSLDDIFNTKDKVAGGLSMFVQDAKDSEPLQQESSKNGFLVYDRNKLKKQESTLRHTDYLQFVESLSINPYTGRIIER